MSETATVTILFTDLVGSTALLQHGPEVADRLRREHTAALRHAIARHRGTEVKSTGDGMMVTFASAADAVAAGGDIQRAVQRLIRDDPRHPGVRVGISTGEAFREDGDWFGPPVVEAARLVAADQAAAGEVLATAVVAALVGKRGGHVYTPLGARELKGFDEPVEVGRFEWQATEPATSPLPPGAAMAVATQLVGREPERERLRERWKAAKAGDAAPRLVLVSGEPGIGKTSLVAQLAVEAHAEGALVLWGRCEEDLGLAYQPFVEAIGHWREHAPDEVDALLPPALAPLLAAMPSRTLASPLPLVDADAARAEMFWGYADLVRSRAESGPILLVVDDLHWADAGSLALLRHLVVALVRQPVLVAATYRDTDLDRSHPLSATLADLRRETQPERIVVRGLARDEIATLVTNDAGGAETDAAFVDSLHDQTAGNPFFLLQVLRHFGEDSAAIPGSARDGALPEGVREVVGRRLSALPAGADHVLSIAAVMGSVFDLRILERLDPAITGGTDLLDHLDAAVSAHLIEEVEGRPGRFTFVHALVRQTLLAELTWARRARLHRAVAGALAEMSADPVLVAHHYCAGAGAGTAAEAGEWALRAAADLDSRLAFEQSEQVISQALQVMELDDQPDRLLRGRLRYARARSLHALDLGVEARKESLAAAEDAAAVGDVETFASAAITTIVRVQLGVPDPEAWAVAEAALAALDPDDHGTRAALLAAMASYRALRNLQGTDADGQVLESIAEARRARDPNSLAYPLSTFLLVHTGAPDLGAQQQMLDELEGMLPSIEVIDLRLPMGATAARHGAVLALQRGDVAASAAAIRRGIDDGYLQRKHRSSDDVEEGSLSHAAVTIFNAMDALRLGDLAAAEAHNEFLRRLAGDDFNLLTTWGAQLFRIRRAQGRLSELVALYRGLVDQMARLPAVVGSHAIALLDTGDLDTAAITIAPLLADDLAAVPRDGTQAMVLADMTEVVAAVRDRDAAAALHERLLPFEGQVLVLSWGIACLGAADSFLGLLDGVLGRHDDAIERLRRGLELDQRAVPALAPRSAAWLEAVEHLNG